MNSFDSSIIIFLNRFSHASKGFDCLMVLVEDNSLIKGGLILSLVWWLWFQRKQTFVLVRERIILTITSCFCAIFLARLLAFSLPFRCRPLHDSALNFVIPYDMNPSDLYAWSAFPSDHAALFFALATGLYLISKKIGLWVGVYVIAVICFPRIYLGIHYPTDVMTGAVLGIGTAYLIHRLSASQYITRFSMQWENRAPGSFYACFFFVTCQISILFDPIREIGIFIGRVWRALGRT